jgi:hypothetical protein
MKEVNSMRWSFDVFKDLIAEFFGLDADDIGTSTTLRDLEIEQDAFVEFLVDSKAQIEECDVELKEESTLYYEVNVDKALYLMCDTIAV